MKLPRQLYGMFRKEIALQSGSFFVLLNRLIIGPIISCVTAGILYTGFFHADQKLALGAMNVNTFGPLLAFGFLVHNYLNSGYYFQFARTIAELHRRTLPLLLVAPCSRLTLTIGMASVDILRLLVLTSLGFWVIGRNHAFTLETLAGEGLIFSLLFAMGLLLGFAKSVFYLTVGHKADVIDNIYLGFVFTSCLYIPIELLPRWLTPFCYYNPIYHAYQAMYLTWRGEDYWNAHLAYFSASLLVMSLALIFLWRLVGQSAEENSFA